MSRIWLSMLAVVWMSAGMSGVASNHIVTIFGSGSGAFESTPVATAGVATATWTLNSTTVEIACTERVHNIVNLTAGHLRVGGPGASGPVVLGISGLPTGSSDDFIHSWTWTESDLRLRSAQGVLKIADVFEACSSGNCYINFHTVLHPSGEVRINMYPQGAAEDRFANGLYQINVCAPGRQTANRLPTPCALRSVRGAHGGPLPTGLAGCRQQPRWVRTVTRPSPD